jgi:hypothetical protein
MKLDAFLLAEAAYASPDGRLFVHGAGITRITAPALPFAHPGFAVVARFTVEEKELERPHEFTATIADPDRTPIFPITTLAFEPGPEPPAPLPPGEERYIQFAMSFGGAVFARAGIHRVEIAVDGKPVRSMTLPVLALNPEEAGQVVEGNTPPPNRAERRRQERKAKPRL